MFSHSTVSGFLWPPWTVAHQVPLSIGFSRQEYQSGLPCSTPGDLPDPGSNSHLLNWQMEFLLRWAAWEAPKCWFRWPLNYSLQLSILMTYVHKMPHLKGSPQLIGPQSSLVAQLCPNLWPHGLQNTRLPYPSPTPGACSNSCPLNQWCYPTISSSVIPFSSCLQSFPALASRHDYWKNHSFD